MQVYFFMLVPCKPATKRVFSLTPLTDYISQQLKEKYETTVENIKCCGASAAISIRVDVRKENKDQKRKKITMP